MLVLQSQVSCSHGNSLCKASTSTLLKLSLRRWPCQYQYQPDQQEAVPASGPGLEGPTTPLSEDPLRASATGIHTT